MEQAVHVRMEAVMVGESGGHGGRVGESVGIEGDGERMNERFVDAGYLIANGRESENGLTDYSIALFVAVVRIPL